MKRTNLLALILAVSIFTTPLTVFADESGSCKSPSDLISWTLGLPFKVVGAALAGGTGLIVGATTGLLRGASKGADVVADAVGNPSGLGETLAGWAIGAAPGAAIHATLGGLTWFAKGVEAGLSKPLKCASVVSAFEGIPDAIEWTAEGASKYAS